MCSMWGGCALIQVHRYFLFFFFYFLSLFSCCILICNFHNFTGLTHTCTHAHLLNLIFTLNFYNDADKKLSRYVYVLLWRSNLNKNSRATSTTDDAHLNYGCGATVASSADGGTPGGSGPRFDATCSRRNQRSTQSCGTTHLHLKLGDSFGFSVFDLHVFGILLASFMLQLYSTMILGTQL